MSDVPVSGLPVSDAPASDVPAAEAPTAPPRFTAPPAWSPPPPPVGPPPAAPTPEPFAPEPAAPRSTRPSGFKQFVVGALVGALVGGATAGGVVALSDDGGSGSTRTVVVQPSTVTGRNTSVVTRTGDIQSILAKVEPAVVVIRTGAAVDAGLFNGNGGNSGGQGTGFVVSPDGIVVTNNHVVADANGQIEVSLSDGTNLKAKVLGQSPDNDLAVLKVDANNLATVKLGSSDDLQVGDDVVAIGNALALEGGLSVTRGIISQKGRTVPEDQTGATLYDMLQTDAAINPGNSGGPLVNAAGEVVGINTALAGDSQNVGFAISIDSAKAVIDELRQGHDVRAPFLGVYTQAITPAITKRLNLTTKTGALIKQVTPNTAAAAAGLEADDVIVAVGGQAVARPDDVGAAIRKHRVGDKVDVVVERDGKQETLTVTLGARPRSN
jgi:S1-C subfamily serine protease